MRLTELSPQFYRYDRRMAQVDIIVGDPDTWRERGCPSERREELRDFRVPVQSLEDAQCVWFLCPKCFASLGGFVGCHMVEVTFAGRGVPAGVGIKNRKGEDVRWQVGGSGLADLTISPSILIEGGCGWHGFVQQGKIV